MSCTCIFTWQAFCSEYEKIDKAYLLPLLPCYSFAFFPILLLVFPVLRLEVMRICYQSLGLSLETESKNRIIWKWFHPMTHSTRSAQMIGNTFSSSLESLCALVGSNTYCKAVGLGAEVLVHIWASTGVRGCMACNNALSITWTFPVQLPPQHHHCGMELTVFSIRFFGTEGEWMLWEQWRKDSVYHLL